MDVKLKTKHIIMLSKLVSKMGIDLDMTEKDPLKLGSKIVMDMINKIHLADKEFYELIGDITGYTPEKVADTEIDELIDVLKEVVKKIANFIKSPKDSTT
jgi:hypothetical protein